MSHPSDGTLRRLLDEPAGVPDRDRAHVAGCPRCRTSLQAARSDADAVAAALPPTADADVDAAWRRLSAAAAHDRPTAPVALPGRRRRALLRSPVAAALGAVVLLGGAGAAAAADWLQVFRTERIAPVTLTQADLVDLPDLSAYGELTVVEEPRVREVADAAAAAAATGLTAPKVDDLPRGVSGDPRLSVADRASAEFTFSAERAARAAAAAGQPLPPLPAGLDGSTFRLVAGPALVAVWSSGSGAPGLVVGRAVAPAAFSSGVPFQVARDYLLSLPGLPAGVADQLREFSGDGSTLPLPVPAELVTTSSADVGGVPARVLTTRDGTITAVVWVQDGVVTAVGGSLRTDEVLAVARGLERP